MNFTNLNHNRDVLSNSHIRQKFMNQSLDGFTTITHGEDHEHQPKLPHSPKLKTTTDNFYKSNDLMNKKAAHQESPPNTYTFKEFSLIENNNK